ncbi:MAG: antibiotic biosynthesis monooxygenase [Ferroplasma sp.]
MMHIGLYYKVKEGHNEEFENTFNSVLNLLKSKPETGFVDGKLYKEVDCPREYMIYTEWKDREAFQKFTEMRAFKDTTSYGKTILEGTPRNKIFGETK